MEAANESRQRTEQWLAGLGAIAVGAMIFSRAVGSYGGSWAAGVVAILVVMARGSAIERLTLVTLLSLSLMLGGETMYLGIRQTLFVAIFMLLARHAPVAPRPALLCYMGALLIALGLTGEISPLFTVGPAIILLLMAAFLIERDRRVGAVGESNWKVGLLSLVSLILPFLGPGSRSALLVWGGFSLRRLSLSLVAAGLLGALVISTASDVEVFDRITNSYDELVNPFPETGINLRAVELLIFISWWNDASKSEILFGSKDIIYMPGDFLGFLYDPPYVPHNQLIGIVFQFGIFGLSIILIYMYSYWRSVSDFPLGRFVMMLYIVLGFMVIHGFVNQDISIVSGVLLHYLRRLQSTPLLNRAVGMPAL